MNTFFNKHGIKTSVSNTKFAVNQKKGCVTCIMTYHFNNDSFIDDVMYAVVPDYWRNKDYTVVGVAYLNDTDTFDEEIGKKIARAKAESQMYKQAGMLIDQTIVKVQEKFVEAGLSFILKAGNVITHNDEYISQF